MSRNPLIQPGLYRHYKGTLYRVTGCGIHTETEEPLALYYQADAPDKQFARPAAMFTDMVEVESKMHPRFTLVEVKSFQGE